ncbi:hypothetical protein [Streptomyces sp. AP-93]|uniref:hypothetical protein n=1 Tax=Streptomyces sp. AP-93 TaxID=2929048 RepID=UPI001FAEC30F|nr:hypothetical protein [Streptomyces sp. AP-93]MCJ0875484.1 hypothetical protein [Streptomyces sp. AP-93]
MDDIDRALIQRRQEDAGRPYAAPAASVGSGVPGHVTVDPTGVSGTRATVVLETFFERPLPL